MAATVSLVHCNAAYGYFRPQVARKTFTTAANSSPP